MMLLPEVKERNSLVDVLIDNYISLSRDWKTSNAIGITIKKYVEKLSSFQTIRVIGLLNQNSEIRDVAWWKSEIKDYCNGNYAFFNTETEDEHFGIPTLEQNSS